jgi:FtsP/CotA-like multicopper oxidase with cupredoxin domain
MKSFQPAAMAALVLVAFVATVSFSAACARQEGASEPLSKADTVSGSAARQTGLRAVDIRVGGDGPFGPTGKTVEYSLTAKLAEWELLPGVKTTAVTYNGTVPGPLLRVTEGDTLKVTLKNELPEPTTIHWHGAHVPSEMDGVQGVSQAPVMPGETFTYQFTASHAGTFMYHSHSHNSAEQIDRGLYGVLIIDPQDKSVTRFDREYTMALQGWMIPAAISGTMQGMGGTRVMPDAQGMDAAAMTEMMQMMMKMMGLAGDGHQTPDGQPMPTPGPGGLDANAMMQMMMQMMGMPGQEQAPDSHDHGTPTPGATPGPAAMDTDAMMRMMQQMMDMAGTGGQGGMNYNYFTINGKSFPATDPYKVKKGDLVRVRIVNPSQTIHPMHLHGHDFKVVAKDGEPIPAAAQMMMNTITLNPGETYDIVFEADNPGRWAFHCHDLHHASNNGVEPGGLTLLVEYEDYSGPVVPTAQATPGQMTPGADSMMATPGATPGMGH